MAKTQHSNSLEITPSGGKSALTELVNIEPVAVLIDNHVIDLAGLRLRIYLITMELNLRIQPETAPRRPTRNVGWPTRMFPGLAIVRNT